MTELLDIRERDGVLEICTTIGTDGAQWEGYATFTVRKQYLVDEDGNPAIMLVDALMAEGWIRPSDDLPVCGRRSTHKQFAGARCLLREGHEGNHRDGGFTWQEGF